jgi:hypothetical protein
MLARQLRLRHPSFADKDLCAAQCYGRVANHSDCSEQPCPETRFESPEPGDECRGGNAHHIAQREC